MTSDQLTFDKIIKLKRELDEASMEDFRKSFVEEYCENAYLLIATEIWEEIRRVLHYSQPDPPEWIKIYEGLKDSSGEPVGYVFFPQALTTPPVAPKKTYEVPIMSKLLGGE